MENHEVTKASLKKEKESYQNLHSTLHKEEEQWRLKSHSIWLLVGYSNTPYFTNKHNKENKKYCLKNSIKIWAGD